ncbi:VOC family protein [Hymenobacter terricola]|uniref:VOC family protein n=1 Tax=Hymenobacter terricola TaxID=2819236 RepID=UPI001B317CB6|nr:hypothetical protein [Hymenobacter terricola]
MPIPTACKLALNVSRPDLDCLQAFAIAVLGAEAVHQEPGLWAGKLPDGNLLELYGPGANPPACLFAHGPVVVSFRVANLGQAMEQAQAAGLLTVSGPTDICPGLSHGYLRLADGMIIGLYEALTAESQIR